MRRPLTADAACIRSTSFAGNSPPERERPEPSYKRLASSSVCHDTLAIVSDDVDLVFIHHSPIFHLINLQHEVARADVRRSHLYCKRSAESKLRQNARMSKLPSLRVGASSVNFVLAVHLLTTELGASCQKSTTVSKCKC